MDLTENDLDKYVVKFSSKYDNTLFTKYGVTIKFPIICCFPEPMEENVVNASFTTKTILCLTFIKPPVPLYSYEPIDTKCKLEFLDNKYHMYLNIMIFCGKINGHAKLWKLNINDKCKLHMQNKIIKYYCVLMMLCGELVKVNDIKIYVIGMLLQFLE